MNERYQRASGAKSFGEGNHPDVVFTPLTSSMRRAVAIEFSMLDVSHQLVESWMECSLTLLNDAKIYNAFHSNLQDGVTTIGPRCYDAF
jgi:hypothetical protein